MDRSDRAREILSAVADTLRADDDLSLPDQLVQACSSSLPVSGVGLVWMSGAGPGALLAPTSCAARVMEELQFVLGEGPCIESSRLSRPVLSPDLYRLTPRPLGKADLAEALAYADAAIGMLLHLPASMDSTELHQAFSRPLSARAEVHQATGMIAVQAGVGLADAVVLLRARSYMTEHPINDLANAKRKGLDPAGAFAAMRAHARSSNQALLCVAEAVINGTSLVDLRVRD